MTPSARRCRMPDAPRPTVVALCLTEHIGELPRELADWVRTRNRPDLAGHRGAGAGSADWAADLAAT